MSEAATEPTEPDEAEQEAAESAPDTEEANPDTEPAEPIEGPEEGAEEPGEAETEPEAEQAQSRALTEKEIDKRNDKVRSENQRHAKRINEIMEEDASDLIPCPVCMSETIAIMEGVPPAVIYADPNARADGAGWIYPPDKAPLPDSAISRIRQVIGLPDYSNFVQAKDARRCPDCNGKGQTKTDSDVPGYETKTCGTCNKQGYVLVGQTTNGTATTVTEFPMTGPTVYGTETSVDPEVQHLRDRGFTVFPPMPIPQNT